MSNSDGESSRLELLVHSLAGTFGSLPACLPACLLFLCTLCILAIRIVELIMHFHIFSPSQYVGNSIASVKSNSKSNCRKSKGYPFFFFFYFVIESWEAVRGINFDSAFFFTSGMRMIMSDVLLKRVNHPSLSPLLKHRFLSSSSHKMPKNIIWNFCNNQLCYPKQNSKSHLSGCPLLTVGGKSNDEVEEEKEKQVEWRKKVMAIWDDSTSMPGIVECNTCISNCHTL